MEQDETPDVDSDPSLSTENKSTKLENALNSEQSAWMWLTQLSDVKLRRAGALAYTMYVLPPTKDAKALIDKGQAEVLDLREPFTSSHSPEGLLVRRILDGGREVVAFFAYIFISQKRREATATMPDIFAVLSDPRFEYERHTASGVINAFYNVNMLAVDGGRDSIYSAASDFQKEIKSLSDESSKQLDGLKEFSDQAKKYFKSDYNNTRRSLARRKRVWRTIVRRTVEDAKSKIESATSQLEATRDALGAQIDLKASVEYWRDRKTSHEQARRKSLTAVFLSMTLTLAAIFGYFWLLSRATTADTKSGETTANKVTSIASSISAQDITVMVTHLFGAALLLTFLGIIVRMALRQYHTHSNCALEAQERITFTKTYLALMHEGKLSSDLDRKLVLESLFRPNAFTSSSEITFSTPIEFFMKAAERVK